MTLPRTDFLGAGLWRRRHGIFLSKIFLLFLDTVLLWKCSPRSILWIQLLDNPHQYRSEMRLEIQRPQGKGTRHFVLILNHWAAVLSCSFPSARLIMTNKRRILAYRLMWAFVMYVRDGNIDWFMMDANVTLIAFLPWHQGFFLLEICIHILDRTMLNLFLARVFEKFHGYFFLIRFLVRIAKNSAKIPRISEYGISRNFADWYYVIHGIRDFPGFQGVPPWSPPLSMLL